MNFIPQPKNLGLPREFLEAGASANALKHLAEDAEVIEKIRRDEIPIPRPEDRIRYHEGKDLDYWLSGYSDYTALQTFLGRDVEGPVLDFGGSTGRVMRHWALSSPGQDLFLCDVNPRFVSWVNMNMWPAVKAVKNEKFPVLPFDDNTFDVIYAFSVFSHIDEHEIGWLMELRRVLRPGGKLMVTIHDERTWALIPNLQFRLATEYLPQTPAYVEYMKQTQEAPDRAVFIPERDLVIVFYSKEYIKKYWVEFFTIEQIASEAHNYQAMVVLQPKK